MKTFLRYLFIYIINLILLFQSFKTFAQSINAGVMINQSINSINNRSTSDINPDRPNMLDNQSTNYFSVEVFGEKVTANNTIYRLTLGINKQTDKNYSTDNASNGDINTRDYKFNLNAYHISIGAGKIYSYEKIQLRVGIEFIFLTRMPSKETIIQQSMNASGNVYGTNRITIDSPAEYFYWLNTFCGIYYNCWKSLYIGVEIGNGFYYNIQNGTKTTNTDYFDSNNNLINTENQTEKIKFSNISSSFLNPAIGIIYKFHLAKKRTDENY